MEFAKYYNATKLMDELMDQGKLLAYEKGSHKAVYICNDTYVIWVARIIEGLNAEHEKSKGSWLIERERIDKYDFADYLEDVTGYTQPSFNDIREMNQYIFQSCSTRNTLSHIIRLDDSNGLSNWDVLECESYDECLDKLKDVYGLLEIE